MAHRPVGPLPCISAPAAYVRALAEAFGKDDEHCARLFEGAELGAADIAGDAVPLSSFLRIVENVTASQGEDWPLRARLVHANAMQGALDVAARSAPTVGDALRVLADHGPVRAPYLRVKLQNSRGGSKLLISLAAELNQSSWRAVAAAVVLSVDSMLTQIVGDEMRTVTMTFPWPKPPYGRGLESLLASRVQYSGDELSMRAPKQVCDATSPFADPALHASAVRDLHFASLHVARSDATALDVTRLIALCLPTRLSEEGAARRLGLSRRTLVRRLAESGRTYRSLLDGVLRKRAEDLLSSKTCSRDEMAAALGYGDPTSFSRACRRWFKI